MLIYEQNTMGDWGLESFDLGEGQLVLEVLFVFVRLCSALGRDQYSEGISCLPC